MKRRRGEDEKRIRRGEEEERRRGGEGEKKKRRREEEEKRRRRREEEEEGDWIDLRDGGYHLNLSFFTQYAELQNQAFWCSQLPPKCVLKSCRRELQCGFGLCSSHWLLDDRWCERIESSSRWLITSLRET